MTTKNGRQEKFCVYIVEGMSQEQAYLKAGYKSSCPTSAACRLAKNESVKKRIEELKQEFFTDKKQDIQRIYNTLRGIIDDPCQPSQAKMKACDLLSKCCGLYSEKVNINGDIQYKWIE